jgi:hypothetical protein
VSRPTEYEIWQEIRRLSDAANLFVVDKEDRIGWTALRQPIYGKVWILYRGRPRQPGCARLGKRRKLSALLRFVKQCAGVT